MVVCSVQSGCSSHTALYCTKRPLGMDALLAKAILLSVAGARFVVSCAEYLRVHDPGLTTPLWRVHALR